MTEASDNFKAYGLPVILLVVLASTIALTHKQFLKAHASSANPVHTWLFRGAILCSLLSVFLFFTAAWAYGLVSTIVCYTIALLVGSGTMQQHAKNFLFVIAGWVAILIGVPQQLTGQGLIQQISTSNCNTFYSSANGPMCKDGWLTFTEILGGFIISLTFLLLLAMIAIATDSDEGLAAGVHVGFGGDLLSHPQQSSGGTAATEYHKA